MTMKPVYDQLEDLTQKFALLVKSYKIPESHIGIFQEFLLAYQKDEYFFDNIDTIETEILPLFAKNIVENIDHITDLTNQEISDFLSGNPVIKTCCDKLEAEGLRAEINRILNTNKHPSTAKLLHFLIPDISKLIFSKSQLITNTAKIFLGQTEDLSFEPVFFNMPPGINSVHWHDDYTLFCNKIPGPLLQKRLLLNFHIALTETTKNSSPLSFLKGTEKIIYARSAIKYFKENNIQFDDALFLKAVFLTENLYKPGEEVKANFIGLLPSLYYRLHQFNAFDEKLEIFFNELEAGQMQIFSPHLCHTSPFINNENSSRESLVLRFFAGSDYNFKNMITVRDFVHFLSIAKGKQLSFPKIHEYFFRGIATLNEDSKMCFNVYLNKSKSTTELPYPRIYLEDLYHFLNG